MNAPAVVTISPEEGLIEDNLYVPGSEEVDADEMRVVALGTGMPSARPKQAGACWLVELGNGDKFLFDIGSECHSRIAAQKIAYDYIDKVFISHLHVDHFGDLGSFWLGGTTMNRLTPLRIWGPSGPEAIYGTRYALNRLQEMYRWDIHTRGAVIDPRGMSLDVTEFDYRGVNKAIFDENGVVIRSFPAAHGFEGSVCYVLEWKGLRFAYSGDNVPNQGWVDHTQKADLAVHESFLPSTLLIERQHFTPIEALNVGTQGHTSPEQFGKAMSMTKPRMAVAYHVYNDRDTAPIIRERIRKFYNGPLAISQDYMVFNITKDNIRVRMSAVDGDVWPLPATREKHAEPDMLKLIPLVTGPSRQTVLNMPEVVGPIYKEINDRYGTHHTPITDSPLFKTINAAMQLKHKVAERAAAFGAVSSEVGLIGSDLEAGMADYAGLRYLRIALISVGVIFLAGIYPLMGIWPSGWTWHTGHSDYPLMIVGIYATLGVFLIIASRNPLEHLSLIWFTVWSSLVHGGIMAIQSIAQQTNRGHLLGDVPALLVVAVGLATLTPRGEGARALRRSTMRP